MSHLLLLSPAANRVYAGAAGALVAAEIEVCTGLTAEPVTVAGVDYLSLDAESLGAAELAAIARSSARLALFDQVGNHGRGELLRPVELPVVDLLDDDFVTIPKYQGKTNEQFTRLLLNVTRAAATLPQGRVPTVLDPLCGRGTTLSVAWTLGLNAAGVEADAKAFEAMGSFWKTWLRRKRLKHTADITPVRRDGKSLGRRFEATARIPAVAGGSSGSAPPLRELTATVFTGDTRDSAKLFGKRRFELIVADAPYGVVHGSQTDVRGVSGRRDRSPAGLLSEAIGVWAGQLTSGGALGLSWNTLGLAREKLADLVAGAGLEVPDGGPWLRFAHRVDSSIHRDILVGRKPQPELP
ncbi:MAG: site-specific DNA-methyltransferase [Propionibacteriaceae bacterium]|nr:site-specific DNA-methyltransferase [Propionibacteriaceae bacterium]